MMPSLREGEKSIALWSKIFCPCLAMTFPKVWEKHVSLLQKKVKSGRELWCRLKKKLYAAFILQEKQLSRAGLVVRVFQSRSWDPSLHSPLIHLIRIWLQINRNMMSLKNTRLNIGTCLPNWGSDFGKQLSNEHHGLIGIGFIKRWSPEDHRSWNIQGE